MDPSSLRYLILDESSRILGEIPPMFVQPQMVLSTPLNPALLPLHEMQSTVSLAAAGLNQATPFNLPLCPQLHAVDPNVITPVVRLVKDAKTELVVSKNGCKQHNYTVSANKMMQVILHLKYSTQNGDVYYHEGFLYHLKKNRVDGSSMYYCIDRMKHKCLAVVEKLADETVVIRSEHQNHERNVAECARRVASRVHREAMKRRYEERLGTVLKQLRDYHEEFDPIFEAEERDEEKRKRREKEKMRKGGDDTISLRNKR